jgi:hypothetical protein
MTRTNRTPKEISGILQPKNPAAVALGRLGGKKGGVARAAALTPEERSEISKKAAAARWAPGKPRTRKRPALSAMEAIAAVLDGL